MTGPENDDIEHDEENYEKMWCYYQQPSQGAMILSDNNDCTIKWFHCNCLRIRKPPNGKWKCPSCRKFTKKMSYSKPITYTKIILSLTIIIFFTYFTTIQSFIIHH